MRASPGAGAAGPPLKDMFAVRINTLKQAPHKHLSFALFRVWHKASREYLCVYLYRYGTYVLYIPLCAMVDTYIACYLPFGCRRHNLLSPL